MGQHDFVPVSLQGKRLSAEQLSFYNENGYIILENFLTPAEVDAIKHLRDRAVKLAADRGGSWRDGPAHYDVEVLKSDPTGKTLALRKIQEVCLIEPTFRDILHQDKMLDVVEDLIGPEIYYHSSKLMCKPAHGGRRKPWHQDYAYWAAMNNVNQITVWIAIDDATRANGCMQVIPGSHKRGLIKHEQLEDFQIREDNIAGENVVYAEMKGGDALFFHVLTLHASDPNNSPRPRLSAIIDFDSAIAPNKGGFGSHKPLRSARVVDTATS